MAIEVQIGNQVLEFPETMTQDEIKQVLREQFSKQPQPVQQVVQEPTRLGNAMQGIKGFGGPESFLGPEELAITPREAIAGVAKAAPYAAAFTPIGLAGQAAITGVSRVAEGLAEEERLPEALKAGAIAAGTESTIGKALKLTKPALKQIAKFATRAEKGVIDEAIKKPILTKIEPKTNIDTSEQIKNAITILNRKKSRDYEKALTKVSEAAKGKVADTKNVNKIIKEDKLDRQGIKRLLLAGRSKVKKFDPNAVDKFIAGKELTFDEAKNVNSVLSDVLRSTTIEPVDKLKIGKLKDSLYKSMEIYPGFKELNKKYAKQATLVQGIEKNLGKDISESKVNTLTNDVIKRLKDKRQTKSRAINLLSDLDKEIKAKGKRSIVNQIEANALQDSISQSIAKKPGLRDLLLTTGLIGGAAVAPEYAIPLAAGKAAQMAIQQEPVARAALRAAQEGVKVPAVLPRIAAKAPAIAVTPIQRQESGSLQPQSLEEIKQERRIK